MLNKNEIIYNAVIYMILLLHNFGYSEFNCIKRTHRFCFYVVTIESKF